MSTVRHELRRLAELAAPVIGTQVGMMMLGVVDNMMLGHLSVEALNSSSLGRLWVIGTLMIGMGLVFGIDPIVSQAHGAREGGKAGLALQHGIVVGLCACVPIALSWCLTEEVLVAWGQDRGLSHQAERYVLAQLPGLPCVLIFTALRQYLQGRGIVHPALWIALLGNIINGGVNWFLIFGHAGFPALGVVGSGLSTALAQVCMLLALVAMIRGQRLHEGAWNGWSRAAFDPAGLRRVLQLGVPVAVQLGLELWAFQVATLWAGELGYSALAAHTIVLNLVSLTFMLPLGVAIGAATRVGNLIGAGDPRGAQRAAWVAFGVGAGLMGLCAIILLTARFLLPRMYTENADVIALAAGILPIAAAFQLFDGTQVVGGGILRGMGKTVPAALFNLFGYYALALPVAAWMIRGGLGLAGIWWGLCIGLFVVAMLLLTWVHLKGPARVDARVM